MNAIPMLGSLGSIVLVASMAGQGQANAGRSYIAAGMFLFATLGFIVVQIDRQRKQRAQKVTGSRTEYLRYLGNVRQVAREAAEQQRRALTWHHPDPAALPALAEERSRVWEHTSSDDELPPGPLRHVHPAALDSSSSLRRARRSTRSTRPAPRPCTGCSSSTGSSPTCRPASTCERSTGSRCAATRTRPGRLARAMICSAATFHSPEHLVVAVSGVRPQPDPLGLAQVAAARPERAGVGRGRAEADGDDLPRGPRRDAPARPQRPAPLRCRRASRHPPRPARDRRRDAAARQPRRTARRSARRHRARPADPVGRAR